MPDLYVDIDGHDVYQLALRAAQCYSLDLYVVTRDYLGADPNLHLIVGQDNEGGASWILANIKRRDICITGDSHLAVNCALRGASVLSPAGEQWGADAVSARNLWTSTIPCFAERLEKLIASAQAKSADPRPTAERSAPRAWRAESHQGLPPGVRLARLAGGAAMSLLRLLQINSKL